MMRGWGALIACGLVLAASAAAAQSAGAGPAAAPLAGCETDLVHLNQLTGWQVRWPQQWAALATASPDKQAEAALSWTDATAALAKERAALTRGIARGTTAPAPVVRRVLDQIEGLLAAPLVPGLDGGQWRTLLDRDIRPAIASHARFLRDSYLPAARQASGLAATPAGHLCFERAAQRWTSRTIGTAEIEAIGTRLLAHYRTKLARLAGVKEAEVPDLLDRLRASADPATTREDIMRISKAAVERARAAAPRWFDTPALPPLTIEPVPQHLEAGVPAGFYERAAEGREAVYRINLSRAPQRRLMAEVIAFHETIPGHHLAFAAMPAGSDSSAGLVEGWAIYAEHLADEMGLYATKQDRIGMVAKHLWAASRLIVEPGLHVHGWSREQAIAFMRSNTTLADEEIEIEVDRYLAMPGQSLAYMIGYDSLQRAREAAERRLGSRFDIRAFHRSILSPDLRSLDDVERMSKAPEPAVSAPTRRSSRPARPGRSASRR